PGASTRLRPRANGGPRAARVTAPATTIFPTPTFGLAATGRDDGGTAPGTRQAQAERRYRAPLPQVVGARGSEGGGLKRRPVGRGRALREPGCALDESPGQPPSAHGP